VRKFYNIETGGIVMLRKHKLLAVTAAIAACGVVFSSLTFASASAVSPKADPQIQHFQLMLNSVTSLPVTQIPVIADGPITDYGMNVLGANGTSAVFDLQRGTITLNTIDYKHSRQHLNPVTCLSVTTQSGTYTINGGTGAYLGIRGHGIFHDRITAIFSRDSSGACTNTIPPQSIQLIDYASGPIWL
jgi:hypothetical protein